MAKYGFNLLWSDEDQGYIVTCPDFPGLSAFGETPEEALEEAKIALDLFIETLQASGAQLPKPTQTFDYSGQVRLRMPKSLHHSLVQKAEMEGVSLNTWLITLLSERNATKKLVDAVCKKVERVENVLHTYQKDVRFITFSRTTTYSQATIKGEDYGKAKPLIN